DETEMPRIRCVGYSQQVAQRKHCAPLSPRYLEGTSRSPRARSASPRDLWLASCHVVSCQSRPRGVTNPISNGTSDLCGDAKTTLDVVVEPEYVHAPCEGRAVQRIDGALECDADD